MKIKLILNWYPFFDSKTWSIQIIVVNWHQWYGDENDNENVLFW